jgi:hypothetical protein
VALADALGAVLAELDTVSGGSPSGLPQMLGASAADGAERRT